MVYSGYQIRNINQKYSQEAEMHSRVLEYRPSPPTFPQPLSLDILTPTESPPVNTANQSIVDLHTTYPDVVGWLSISNTRIDYPFAQGSDNNYYLRLDLDKNRSQAGTIFIDFRNCKEFSDFNTIVFGHNMRNGSMFGELQRYRDLNFFTNNSGGTIFLAHATFEIEFIAFAVIKPNDEVIYNPDITTEADRIIFFDHVKSVARHYRDIDITADDRIVTLSTCSYEFDNARMVLIGRIK